MNLLYSRLRMLLLFEFRRLRHHLGSLLPIRISSLSHFFQYLTFIAGTLEVRWILNHINVNLLRIDWLRHGPRATFRFALARLALLLHDYIQIMLMRVKWLREYIASLFDFLLLLKLG